MQLKKTSHKKRNTIITIVVAVLLIAGGSYYVYATHIASHSSNNSNRASSTTSSASTSSSAATNYDEATDEQKAAGEQAADKDDTSGATSSSSSVSSNLGITISALSQTGPTVSLRTLLNTITASGTCTLIVTANGKSITKTAGIQALSSSSTCQGFDINSSELGTGSWTFNLTVTTPSASGTVNRTFVVK